MAAEKKLKIVVPTNFSKKSECALDFALQYTQLHNADVYLFHVIEERSRDYRELDRLNVEIMERMKTAVMQAIERLSASGGKHTVEQVHRRVSHGKPGQEVLVIAEGIQADMVVMGATTTKTFKELVTKTPSTLVLVKEKALP